MMCGGTATQDGPFTDMDQHDQSCISTFKTAKHADKIRVIGVHVGQYQT